MGNKFINYGARSAVKNAKILKVVLATGVISVASGIQAGARDGSDPALDVDRTPLQMMVSLEDQQIQVFRGTELLKTSPISSGKPGNSTPTGIFSILEKRRRHFSNLYNNAPMPFMQRLTWSGVALHQGKLPGYPASHGCIRLPKSFAKDLFGLTSRGLHVVVTRGAEQPRIIGHDVLPQPMRVGAKLASLSPSVIAADPVLRGTIATASLETGTQVATKPDPNFEVPLRMIITPRKPVDRNRSVQRMLNDMGFNAGIVDGIVGRRTKAAIRLFQEGEHLPVTGRITNGLVAALYKASGFEKPPTATIRVRRKFRDIYSAPIHFEQPQAPIGTHMFTALDFDEQSHVTQWMAVTAESKDGVSPESVLNRVKLPENVRRDIEQMLTPGSSLIVTDRSYRRNTGLGTDFVVVTR